jgi:O-antigen/teichoic acid export membrane protein
MIKEVLQKKDKKHSLIANTIFSFISQILTIVIPLVTAPYLSRVLGAEGNGQISFSSSIVSYFVLFATFGFTEYGQREIAKRQQSVEERSKCFWEIFLVRFFLTIIIYIVFLSLIFGNVFEPKYTLLILLLSISVIATPFDIQFFFQGMEMFSSIVLRTIFIKIIGIISIFIFVKTQDDIWIYALSLSLCTLIANLVMWPFAFKYLVYVPISKLKIWKHFLPSLFIFLPSLTSTIYSVFDSTMIGYLANGFNADYENGCYSQAYKINSILLLLPCILTPTLIPRNAHDYSSGDFEAMKDHLYYAAHYSIMVSLPLICGTCVLSRNLTSWFLGDGYDEVPILLNIMSVRFFTVGLTDVFCRELFVVIGKEKYCTIATLVAALINVGLNFLFIPRLGATGAAITTAIAEVVVLVVALIIVWRKHYLSIFKIATFLPRYIIATGIMFVPVFYLNKYLSYSVWSFLLITFVGVLTYALVLLLTNDSFFISIIKKLWYKFVSVLIKIKNKRLVRK